VLANRLFARIGNNAWKSDEDLTTLVQASSFVMLRLLFVTTCPENHGRAEQIMKFKDYYETCGVQRGATDDEIKRAYRKLHASTIRT